MQTVNFKCGHCGKLMAVSTAHLGQQVRCPSCQRVVVAPAAAAPPAIVPPPPAPIPVPPVPAPVNPPLMLEPTFNFNRSESDSIFAPPEPPDALFDAPPPPRLEIPPAPEFVPAPPPPPLEAPAPVEADPPATVFSDSPEPAGEPTAPYSPFDGPEQGEAAAVHVEDAPVPFVGQSENGIPGMTNEVVLGTSSEPVRRLRKAQGAGMWIWFLILPLISYAILATILLIILALKVFNSAPPTLLDKMPDVDGDNPGIRRGERASWPVSEREKVARSALPAWLRTTLGKPITIGDLEVKPIKVEQKIVSVFVEGYPKPEPCECPSLVLSLRLRNLARDYSFTPLEPYFDRRYDPKSGTGRPFTQLEIGSRVFYGGPAAWYPRNRDPNLRLNREWVSGRKNFDDEGLAPDQAVDTFVCTDGKDAKVVPASESFKGTFLWRVHLRRGLVLNKGKNKPATAIVGVEFTPDQIVKIDQ